MIQEKKHIALAVGILAVVVAVGWYALWSRQGSDFNMNALSPLSHLAPALQEKRVADIIATGNSNACALAHGVTIDGLNYETLCRNNIALNHALATLDAPSCNALDDKLMSINQCKQQVAIAKLTKTHEITACDDSPTPALRAQCQDIYWTNTAKSKNDPRLCAKVSTDVAQHDCTDSFWMQTLLAGNLSLNCQSFSTTELQSACLAFETIVAAARQGTHQPKKCQVIGDTDLMLAKACVRYSK